MPNISDVIKKYTTIENKNLEAVSNLDEFSIKYL